MVLLYNDKTAVDVPDCKMMKIWLSQNFLIGTAPRSLDKRHGQVRKCRRNLTSYCSASDLAPYNTKCCEKVSPLYTWVGLHFCDSKWGEGKQHNAKTWSRLNAHIATDFWIVGTWCIQYFKNWRRWLKTSKSFKGNHSRHDMTSQAVNAAAIAINCWRPRGGNFKLCSIGNPYWIAASCSFALGTAAS